MRFAKHITSVLAVLFCLGFSLTAAAAVPGTMTYQGELSDLNGDAVNTTVNASFRIFDAKVGGTEAWSEPVSSVTVTNGSFSVQLGAQTPLDGVFDGQPYWLEVSLNGSPLSPRTPIESVPYAFRAADADTVGGKTSAQIIAAAQTGGSGAAEDLLYDGSTSGLNATSIQAALDELAALQAEMTTELNALKDLTQHMKLENVNGYQAVTFTGVNVHVRSGSGSTDGQINGLGNLVVGYDEAGQVGTKDGSHNLVVGSAHGYSSFGGFVAGYNNDLSGEFSSISGGYKNELVSAFSSISGGAQNAISADYASISGGRENHAEAEYSSISGGHRNMTLGEGSSISGGYLNETRSSSDYSSISGGSENRTEGPYTSVSGGIENKASARSSSISGGHKNETNREYSSVSGGAGNITEGLYASVCGGFSNVAQGEYATVSGGVENLARGMASSVSGGEFNEATETASSVSGGSRNIASGESASVSGGKSRHASDSYNWRAGTLVQVQ